MFWLNHLKGLLWKQEGSHGLVDNSGRWFKMNIKLKMAIIHVEEQKVTNQFSLPKYSEKFQSLCTLSHDNGGQAISKVQIVVLLWIIFKIIHGESMILGWIIIKPVCLGRTKREAIARKNNMLWSLWSWLTWFCCEI